MRMRRWWQVAEGNARSAHEAGLPPARVEAWRSAILAALDARPDWLGARAERGSCGARMAICISAISASGSGRPVPFDALEFDEAMATIDLGYDLAFLLMDLDLRVGRAAANRVMNRYVARSGDAGMLRGLPPFLSLRAMIRAHVEARRGQRTGDALSRCGARLSAAGAGAGGGDRRPAGHRQDHAGPPRSRPCWARAPGAVHLRSDEIRKRLHGHGISGRACRKRLTARRRTSAPTSPWSRPCGRRQRAGRR